MTKERDPQRDLQHTLVRVTLDCHAFFGSLLGRLPVRWVTEKDVGCDTAYTDGKSIVMNKEFMSTLNRREQMFVLVHEVMHCAMLHHTRGQGKLAKKWNYATDYAINDLLIQEGMLMPKMGLHDVKWRGMAAEQIYNELTDDDVPEDFLSLGVVGTPKPDDENNKDGGNQGGEAEIRASEAFWKQALQEAAQVAKQRGNMSAGLTRLVNEILESKVNWREVLQRFMTERAPDDFTWAKPARRLIGSGIYMPKRIAEDSMGTMVVGVDTSGSMTDKLLQQIAGELNDIKAHVKPERLVVIYCDAKVNHVDEFGPSDDIELSMRGGGGTDFRPVFDYIEQNELDPRCLVYFTDTFGDFPDEQPDYPVLWGILAKDGKVPWGESVLVEEEADD